MQQNLLRLSATLIVANNCLDGGRSIGAESSGRGRWKQNQQHGWRGKAGVRPNLTIPI
jgi:hypothetical protein